MWKLYDAVITENIYRQLYVIAHKCTQNINDAWQKFLKNWTNSLEDTGFEMFQNYCDGRCHFDLAVT